MIEAPLFGANGARRKGGFALPEDYFDGTVNEPALHQAVKAHLANQRQGTHATRTRGLVTGGNRKPWRQKGTGRARQGSTRAPHWPGGGKVFGPHPRDYRQALPKKVRQLARRSALNARAREGSLWVIDGVEFEAPKTARFAALLDSMGLAGRKVLVLTNGLKRNVYLSGRNLPSVEVMPYPDAAAYAVLWSDAVVVEQAALIGGQVGNGGEAPGEPVEPATEAAAPPGKPRSGARGGRRSQGGGTRKAGPKAAAGARPRAGKRPAPKKKEGSK
jgi:large subunit ribosomal protein L4